MDMQRGQRDKLEKYINISEEFTALVMIKGDSPCKFVCLGVDENEVIVNYNYMVSAVKKETPNAEIRYSPIQNGAAFKIKLAALPQNINKLVFAVGLDGEGVMSDTQNFMVRIGQNNQVAISMTLTGSDFGNEKSIVLFEIYLKSNVWRFWAVVNGYNDNLKALINKYMPTAAPKNNFSTDKLEKRNIEKTLPKIELKKPEKVNEEMPEKVDAKATLPRRNKNSIEELQKAAADGDFEASNTLVNLYGGDSNSLLRLRWLSEHKINLKNYMIKKHEDYVSLLSDTSPLDDFVNVMKEGEPVFKIFNDKITLTSEFNTAVAIYSYLWLAQILAIKKFQKECLPFKDMRDKTNVETVKQIANKSLTDFGEFMIGFLAPEDEDELIDETLFDSENFGISPRAFVNNPWLGNIDEVYGESFDILIQSALKDTPDKDFYVLYANALGFVGGISIFMQEALLKLGFPMLQKENITHSNELLEIAKHGKLSLTESIEFLTAALKINPLNMEVYKSLFGLYGDKKEDLAIIASYVHIEGYFKKECGKYINNDVQKHIENLNNTTIPQKVKTTPKPAVKRPAMKQPPAKAQETKPFAKSAAVPQYNPVTKINGGYNFNILGKYKFSLSDANADYMRFCWNFFNTTLALSFSLEKNAGEIKNYDHMIGSPQAVTLALKNLIDFYIETFLIKQGIFEYDQNYFFNPIEEDLILEFKDFFAAEETVQNYQRQLQIAYDNRSRFQGGGFGITGAIKGAIKAEILNVGADMASGLFKTITGTTNADKVRNLKSKLFREIYLADPNLLAKRFNNMAVMLIDPFYEVLIRHGKANGNLSLNKRGAVARLDNVTRLYNKGEYDKDEAIGELMRCFESNPGYFECGLAIAQLEPRIIKELLKALSGGNNFEHIERNIYNMLSYAKVTRLQKYTSDANILRNASMAAFNQDEFNFITENKLYEARKERVIYIVDTEVVIPLELKNMKYVGLGEARCYINYPTIIHFERLGLTFENIKFDKKYENLIKNYNQFYDALVLIDKKNYANGLEIIKETAKDGFDDANYFLYWIYNEGTLGEEKDEHTAKTYFQKVNIDNLCISLLWLSLALISGEHEGIYIDDDKAMSFLNAYLGNKYIDLKGEKTACRILGSLYADKKDVKNAAKFLERAIDLGDAFSLYARAKVGDLSPMEELKYLTDAYELGVPEASYELGLKAENGFDLSKGMGDINNAIGFYQDAANKNYAPALLKLGQIYIEGKGTDKRPIAAADYFERAYNLGNIKAAVELGICYANGEGVELDYEKAFELHRAAAYTGNAEGAYNLGLCYYYGAGTAKDVKMAKDWLEDAAKKGSSDAKKAVEELF